MKKEQVFYEVKVTKRVLVTDTDQPGDRGVEARQEVLEVTGPPGEVEGALRSFADRLAKLGPDGKPRGFAGFLVEASKAVKDAQEKAAKEGKPDPVKAFFDGFKDLSAPAAGTRTTAPRSPRA